jgi:hypothetical protein
MAGISGWGISGVVSVGDDLGGLCGGNRLNFACIGLKIARKLRDWGEPALFATGVSRENAGCVLESA